jgi:hypothetical protein
MHISLDSALGRQRRLNSVGESITQIAPDPAAAYSLRSLTGADPKVVRVRRASDNHEQDFTASDVSSGALQDFVNAQVVAPLDIQALSATGRDGDFLIAKAAYSLRSLGTRQATVAATGDTVARADGKYVCQVRSVTGDVKSFTATEVSDGTLVDFVLGNTVSLVNNRAYFDGSSNYISYSNGSDFSLSSNESFELSFNFVYVESSNLNRRILSVADSSGNSNVFEIYKQPSAASNAIGIMFGGDSTAKVNTGTLTSGKEYLIKFGYDGSSFFCDLDGTTVGSSTETHSGISTAGNLVVGARHDTNQKASGVISNISFSKSSTTVFSVSGHGTTASNWTSDQSDSPTINGTLAAYTGQEMDGFVKTWYDQSVTTQAGDTATGNHATQATAANQPKIVSAGSLLTLSGKPTIKPDGTDDFLINESSIWDTISNSALSCFTLTEKTSVTNKILWAIGSSSNEDGDWLIGGAGTAGNVQFRGGRVNSANSSIGTSGTVLLTALDVSGGDGFVDGTAIGSPSSATPGVTADRLVLFNRRGSSSSSTFTDQSISEVIFYGDDQTDNRTAIEANIGEAYSIDLPSGVDSGDNAVDGFVETWYDQSGNGNNAVQATAASQPKIVNAGSLLADGIDFDGTDDELETAANISGSNISGFVVANLDGTAAQSLYSVGNTKPNALFGNPSLAYVLNGGVALSGGTAPTNTDTLFTQLFISGGTSKTFIDGSAIASGDAGSNTASSDKLTIGNLESGNRFMDGSINELIIYTSDQTDNRSNDRRGSLWFYI